MLVLKCEKGARLFFELPDGGLITVKILEVRAGGRVRLGIDAPEYVSVEREEVRERRLQQAEDAADIRR